jgi:hypothetical protein
MLGTFQQLQQSRIWPFMGLEALLAVERPLQDAQLANDAGRQPACQILEDEDEVGSDLAEARLSSIVLGWLRRRRRPQTIACLECY